MSQLKRIRRCFIFILPVLCTFFVFKMAICECEYIGLHKNTFSEGEGVLLKEKVIIRDAEDKMKAHGYLIGPEIPHLYRTQKLISVLTKTCNLDLALNQINPVLTLKHYFLNVHFNIILLSTPRSLTHVFL